jgi:sterol 3beta-glucosyltransferase
MIILIPTIGTRGDVQPFIALAQGLICAGHTVTLASHPVMKNLVESHGIAFAPIGPDIDLAEETAAIRQRSRNAVIGLVRGMRFGLEMVELSHEDILALCRDVDLLVVPAASAAGKNEADLMDLPYLSVSFMPWAIPWDEPGRPFMKRVVYGAIDGLVSLITTQPLNRMRNRQGLPPVGKEGFTSARLNLVPISPVVFPPNPHWEDRHHTTGYWFVEEPAGWQPQADLLDFLDDGSPPLLFSLGAMSLGDGDARATASLFIDAIQRAGVRAIIQGWEMGMRQLDLPPKIYSARSLPHSWLLSHCAGLVHHGGFGTTSAGLRAGIPALVIPHMADQFYWAQRIHELGASPQPIRRTRLEAAGLGAALQELVQDDNLRTKASTLGKQIRAENGVENAVRLIEETFP